MAVTGRDRKSSPRRVHLSTQRDMKCTAMRAVVCENYGSLDDLRVVDVAEPVATADQVVVEVRAAAVNFTDVLLVHDRYQVSASLPFTPGSEFSGVVNSVADDVTTLAVGDRIFGMTFVGGFAERVAVGCSSLKRIPDGVEFAAAAGFYVTYATAHGALRWAAEIRPGDCVVVLGAAGGVGLAAVQLAKSMGGRVIAAASSPAKLAICREEGAVEGIDYSREPLKERIKELTGGEGADIVIDPVGGDLAEAAFRALGWRGRFVVVGFASGEIPKIALNLPLLKGSEIRAFNIAPFSVKEPGAMRELEDELMEMLASGIARPRVTARYPLAEAAAAIGEVAERRAMGKVVVEP